MTEFRPKQPFSQAIFLYIPTYSRVNGVTKKQYSNGIRINAAVQSFGGTEITANNLYVIEDTAQVTTWYRPDIKSDCKIEINKKTYEILGEPENINLRNQFITFKIRRIKGTV